MRNLGILIERPGYNQKFLGILENSTKLSPDINLVVFFYDYGPVKWNINFAMMEIIHAYNFPGTLIATDYFTADVMHNALQTQRKYNYIWDMNHVFTGIPDTVLNSQFNNPLSELIVRNEFVAQNIRKVWGREPIIMDNFNYEQLGQLC